MSNDFFTPKQAEVISLVKHGKLKRLNILEGSVRSGKTWVSLIAWALWVATMPKKGNYLMSAKSLTALKRNCLDVMQELVGADNFTYSGAAKEGRLFGRKVYLEGANDARAEAKIRGLTLQGAYCDELTQIPEDFFTMLLSRLSEPNAKLIGTTNPDNPMHWLMKGYIERKDELDMLVLKFLIDDNTHLDPVYVEQLKKEYTGVFYDRFILGLWKAAEGAIYRQFADNPKRYTVEGEPPAIRLASIGVDFGGNGSAHAFVCTGFTAGFREVVTLDEYYRKEIISPTQLENDFIEFVRRCQSKYKVADAYCDSAEQTLIQGLRTACARARVPIAIHNARKGAINDRIRFYCRLMSSGRYFVMPHCKHLIGAFQSAVWDAKNLTEDVRLDDGNYNIDSLDASEYSTEPFMGSVTGIL